MAPAGAGEAVTATARAANFDADELGELAALTGNPVPGWPASWPGGSPRPPSAPCIAALPARTSWTPPRCCSPGGRSASSWPTWPRPPTPRPGWPREHRGTIMIGRTLLQQAVPVTFGLVAAGWLTGVDEARAGLAVVGSRRLAVQFGGAAGTLASLGDRGRRGRGLARRASSAWRCPCCPGTPTGCGSSTWAPRWPGPRPRSARSPGTSRCWPSPRSARSARARPRRTARGSGRAAVRRRVGAAPWRLLRDAEQAQPGRRDRHPRLHPAGPRAARHPRRRRRAGAPARGRRVARGVGAADGPAAADRLGLELGGRTAVRAHRGHLADGRATWPRPRACRSPRTSPRCWPASWARPRRTTWWPRRVTRAVSAGLPLRDVLLSVPKLEDRLVSAGITAGADRRRAWTRPATWARRMPLPPPP